MKKLIAFVLALTCVLGLVGCNNSSVGETVPPASEEAVVGGDLAPMVMIDGFVYVDIGEESTRTERNDGFDGEITSTVTQNQEPTENDQSNFGIGYGYQYGPNGTIEILMNDKWWFFVVMADAV